MYLQEVFQLQEVILACQQAVDWQRLQDWEEGLGYWERQQRVVLEAWLAIGEEVFEWLGGGEDYARLELAVEEPVLAPSLAPALDGFLAFAGVDGVS